MLIKKKSLRLYPSLTDLIIELLMLNQWLVIIFHDGNCFIFLILNLKNI